MTTSLSRGRGTVSRPGARPVPTMWFFTREPRWYCQSGSGRRCTSSGSPLRQHRVFVLGPCMWSKCEVEQKQWGANEILRQCLRSFHVSWLQVTAVGWVSPRVSPPFIVHQHPIIAPVTGKFTFLPRRPPLTTVKSPKGRTRLLLGSAPAWAVRGSSEARFSPCGRLVVSSTHLGDGTALTDEGLLLGKMAFGSFYHVRSG
jgi:hypothetical protein